MEQLILEAYKKLIEENHKLRLARQQNADALENVIEETLMSAMTDVEMVVQGFKSEGRINHLNNVYHEVYGMIVAYGMLTPFDDLLEHNKPCKEMFEKLADAILKGE